MRLYNNGEPIVGLSKREVRDSLALFEGLFSAFLDGP